MQKDFNAALNEILGRALFKKKPSHDAVLRVLGRFNNPHNAVKIVHVAGTNGKGSVSAIIAAIFKEYGLKTGLYTSPHLINIRERIRINGLKISEEDFAALAFSVMEREDEKLTFFEFLTVMAFEYFRNCGCGVCVIETGIGGLKDVTNVIKESLAAVITWIDLDHTRLLGDSLEKIAAEKAGIIKKNGIIICAEKKAVPLNVITKKAEEQNTKLVLPKERVKCAEIIYGKGRARYVLDGKAFFESSLTGDYQPQNMQTALAAVQECAPALGLSEGLLEEKFIAACEKVIWPARFQIEHKDGREYIIDGGHNPQALEYFVRNYKAMPGNESSCFIIAMMKDKDYNAALRTLSPIVKNAVAVSVSERGLDAGELCLILETLGINSLPAKDFGDALRQAQKFKRIVVCGSFYLAGEMLKALNVDF